MINSSLSVFGHFDSYSSSNSHIFLSLFISFLSKFLKIWGLTWWYSHYQYLLFDGVTQFICSSWFIPSSSSFLRSPPNTFLYLLPLASPMSSLPPSLLSPPPVPSDPPRVSFHSILSQPPVVPSSPPAPLIWPPRSHPLLLLLSDSSSTSEHFFLLIPDWILLEDLTVACSLFTLTRAFSCLGISLCLWKQWSNFLSCLHGTTVVLFKSDSH